MHMPNMYIQYIYIINTYTCHMNKAKNYEDKNILDVSGSGQDRIVGH